MLTKAPSYAAAVTDFLTYLFTGFPPQRQSPGVIFVLLRALDSVWLKGSSQLSGVATLDFTHHHSQVSIEEPHP